MITQGRWKHEPWSKKEGMVVAHHEGKRSLICGGVLNDDAILIAESKELLEVLENLLIHIGMGWEIDVLLEQGNTVVNRVRGETK